MRLNQKAKDGWKLWVGGNFRAAVFAFVAFLYLTFELLC